MVGTHNILVECRLPPIAGLGVTGPEISATDLGADWHDIDLDTGFAPLEAPRRAVVGDMGVIGATPPGLEEPTVLVRGAIDAARVDEVVASLMERGEVAGVFSDPDIELCQTCLNSVAIKSETELAQLWCLPELQARGLTGEGVLVAVVDSGISLQTLTQKGKTPGLDTKRSWRFPGSSTSPGQAPAGHGTMCAYDVTVCAPRCTLLDFQIVPASSFRVSLSRAHAALTHLKQLVVNKDFGGPKKGLVVNLSWSLYHPSDDGFPEGSPHNYSANPDHPFNRLVGELAAMGVDFVFAAGNCGPGCPAPACGGVTAATIYGANSHHQALAVGAVDLNLKLLGYSSQGPGKLQSQKPDFCAFSHFRGSGNTPADNGTSAAAALVSGLVAAIRTRLPTHPTDSLRSPAAVRDLLRSMCLKPQGAPPFDFMFGRGVLAACLLKNVFPP